MNDVIKGILDGAESKGITLEKQLTEVMSNEEAQNYMNELQSKYENELKDKIKYALASNPQVKDAAITIGDFMNQTLSNSCLSCGNKNPALVWLESQFRENFVSELRLPFDKKYSTEKESLISMLLNNLDVNNPEYKKALLVLRKLDLESWAIHNFSR